ncbi:MAG: hypothetical protein AAGC46_00925 [Solirubrobacteraceae bacterium]|nr:hypothetical protein [Patulibacter sp.]
MSVLALTTSLFNAYDTAAVAAAQAAREAARAKSKAALSEVKPLDKGNGGSSRGFDSKDSKGSSAAPVSNLQLLRRAMDAHTIDVDA